MKQERKFPAVTVTRKAENSIRQGHPWVYREEFTAVSGEPEQGGGTVFPDIQLEVAPKRGNAVFFSYERAHPSTRTLHGGAPVLAGEKWVATKWMRERRFD